MGINEMYEELLAEGLYEEEAARLIEELYAPLPTVYREAGVLGVLAVVSLTLLIVALTIGGL